ncbi:MAG: Crp/Fnr family transcriptional regulator [Clostridia bacterium]|nr:Crp/Fnr family transcriptional regulator [Clostridia bacterium]
MNNENIKNIITKNFPPWVYLSDDEQAKLLSNCSLISFNKGANLHNGDEQCLGMLIIVNGFLRAYILSEQGREITLYRLKPGDTCVLSASCILSEITFDVHIAAEEDTQAILINSAFFANLRDENIYVANYAYQLATERFSDVMWALQQVLFMKMDQRLAIFLWDELSKTTDQTIHLSHEQIAKYLGSAREVVSRMLKYFAQEGIVSVTRKGITIIDKNKLRDLAL